MFLILVEKEIQFSSQMNWPLVEIQATNIRSMRRSLLAS